MPNKIPKIALVALFGVAWAANPTSIGSRTMPQQIVPNPVVQCQVVHYIRQSADPLVRKADSQMYYHRYQAGWACLPVDSEENFNRHAERFQQEPDFRGWIGRPKWSAANTVSGVILFYLTTPKENGSAQIVGIYVPVDSRESFEHFKSLYKSSCSTFWRWTAEHEWDDIVAIIPEIGRPARPVVAQSRHDIRSF